ncbi:hypothetical protein, partial [Serratia marcescens]|uniref:hypothetical protein n=1 Tax=Serratia marcescens TaxID=615 RepID=UPI001C37AF66
MDENAQRSRFRCGIKRDRLPHEACGAGETREADGAGRRSELQAAVAVKPARHVRGDDLGDLFVSRFG